MSFIAIVEALYHIYIFRRLYIISSSSLICSLAEFKKLSDNVCLTSRIHHILECVIYK